MRPRLFRPSHRGRSIAWTLLPGLLLLLTGMVGAPGKAAAWWNTDWSFRRELTIDAGATGGALPEDAGRLPILVRLHDGNFKFGDAKSDGTDLRFVAEDDKTPLNAHVELFDTVFDLGLVWVDIPSVKAGATVKIWMYYGNPKADSGSDPHAAYDADQVLVYHFGERSGAPQDWTSYGNNALNQIPADSGALIGGGAKFNGTQALIIPGSPSLAVSPGGPLTWAAWVKPDNLQGTQILYARHDGKLSLVIGLDGGTPFVTVQPATGPAITGRSDIALVAGQWHHVAVTANQQVLLYVDGQPHQTLPTGLPPLTTGATLGGDAAAIAGAMGPVTSGFSGSLDELEISKTARSGGYIRGLFASQGPDAKMVQAGKDEANSGLSGGYFGVILKSVTIDGWVIIGVLMVMAVMSWYVMYERAAYLGKVKKYNAIFLTAYRAANRDVVRFEQSMLGNFGTQPTRGQFLQIERSPLYKMLSITVDELEERYGRDKNGAIAPFTLSEPTLEAIRAAIDAELVVQIQKLNGTMVLLTIAISGGPFIGLLGTVIGVMITFAAIAASGDVNVNSIAPGIAAALVANQRRAVRRDPGIVRLQLSARQGEGSVDDHERLRRAVHYPSPRTLSRRRSCRA